MPDLDLRFNRHIETHRADELERIRAYARREAERDEFELEIGANRGRFLVRYARKYPDRYILGIEKRSKYVRKARERLRDLEISNLDILHADAKLAVPVIFDPGQLQNIYLLYPDPWWKTKHRKRRIVRPDFLEILADKMAIGCGLWIRTDVGPYALQMRSRLSKNPRLRPLHLRDGSPDLPRSTREEDVLSQGLPVHLVYAVRGQY